MNTGSRQQSFDESTIEWDQARGVIRSRLIRQLGTVEPTQLDDLVQETCVRLLRVLRRGGVENAEAMMTTIAQRTAIDHIRRRQRAGVLFEPMSDQVIDQTASAPQPAAYVGDPQQRVAFVVLEFFRTRKSACHVLASSYFKSKSWKTVAADLEASYDGVRVRWSRCLAMLRSELQNEPSLGQLREWICCT